jgi:hypothetical protein
VGLTSPHHKVTSSLQTLHRAQEVNGLGNEKWALDATAEEHRKIALSRRVFEAGTL